MAITDDNTDEMVKIDCRVPESLLRAIDETYDQRGYSSRSEAIRDALRDWLKPSLELSDEIRADLDVSRQQAKRGETIPLSDVMDKYDVEYSDRDEK
jgi:metal-responsive CopG/Arc/MetJ family transcriptional regulator